MMADRPTDEVLRRELIALGEKKVGPITATTRPLYIKKLNHLRARQNAANRSPTKRGVSKKLLGFSSDESDRECENAGSGARRVRKTTPRKQPSPAPRSYARPSLRRRGALDDSGPNTSSFTAQASLSESGFNSSHLDHEYSSNDSANLDLPDNSIPDVDQFDSSDNDEDYSTNSSPASPPQMASVSMNTSSRLDDSRFWGGHYSPSSFTKSRYDSVHHTPSSASVRTPPQSRNKNHLSPPGMSRKSQSEEELRKYGFKTREDPASYNLSHYISMFVLVLAAVFFLVLGFMYINIRGSFASPTVQPDINLLICSSSNQVTGTENTAPKTLCFSQEDIDKTLPIAADLIDITSARAGAVECRRLTGEKAMNWTECLLILTEMGHEKQTLENSNIQSVLFTLFLANEPLNVRLYDEKKKVLTINDAVDKNPSMVSVVESTLPDMSIICRLDRAFKGVINLFIMIVIAALILSMGMMFVKYRWRKQQEEKNLVFNLVEQIIDVLKEHHEESKTNRDMEEYLAIPHVRDMLIPPQERNKKRSLWNKAVTYLSANESRVRVEQQKIKGEEFPVWRWLQASSNGGKVWQGQAFGENSEGAASNLYPYSPTACLKIRNMFDLAIEYGEDWHVKIQDAILEKCGATHGVLHVAVDKTSSEGCVYVKCASAEAAGKAFRALHGWWFDGNLVTVKYLRLERYHERFPDAARCTRPMLPSNNKCLSLSQPYHKSIIETS